MWRSASQRMHGEHDITPKITDLLSCHFRFELSHFELDVPLCVRETGFHPLDCCDSMQYRCIHALQCHRFRGNRFIGFETMANTGGVIGVDFCQKDFLLAALHLHFEKVNPIPQFLIPSVQSAKFPLHRFPTFRHFLVIHTDRVLQPQSLTVQVARLAFRECDHFLNFVQSLDLLLGRFLVLEYCPSIGVYASQFCRELGQLLALYLLRFEVFHGFLPNLA
jgi:hypothetical protein